MVRPKGKIVKGMSLEPISKKLADLLNKEVLFNKNIINENTLSEIKKIPKWIYNDVRKYSF